MSPRAACRLESVGFTSVYDYAGGKTDWTARGLPTEGTYAQIPRAGAIVDRDIATCGLGDRVGEVKTRLSGEGKTVCLVTSKDGIVLGRLRDEALEDQDALAGDAMEPGPTTVRYDESLPDLVQRMQKARVASIIVTDPSGRLVGIMHRRDAEEVLERLSREHAEHHHH